VGVATTRTSGAGGVEFCNPRPSVEASIGTQPAGGGVTTRAAVTLTCDGRVTGGLEIGQLARRESESRSSSVDSFNGDTFAENMSGGRTESFQGGFANIAFGSRFLNPRFVASAGAYHEVAWSDQASSHTTHIDGTTTHFEFHQHSSTWRPGIGVGLGVSAPVWQHVSLGAEARGHWSGNGNMALTTVLSMRFRP
jgi:opacity protein-like surface antigen